MLITENKAKFTSVEETLKDFRDRNRRIQNSPALLLEQERLGREVAVLIGVFTTLKQQFETTKIEEVQKSDYVIVLDHPEAPLSYSKPNKKRITTRTRLHTLAPPKKIKGLSPLGDRSCLYGRGRQHCSDTRLYTAEMRQYRHDRPCNLSPDRNTMLLIRH